MSNKDNLELVIYKLTDAYKLCCEESDALIKQREEMQSEIEHLKRLDEKVKTRIGQIKTWLRIYGKKNVNVTNGYNEKLELLESLYNE